MSKSKQIAYGDKMLAEKDGAVGWMIFNNPDRHNALSISMWQAIPEILNDFESDEDIRVIVLKGAGEKAFISGADISEFKESRASADAVTRYDKLVQDASNRLSNTAQPTISMIRGYCMGGGLAIAISCDMRIATQSSRFAIPAAKLGIGYRASSLQPLVSLVGPSFAKEILITARQFDSDEAAAMGLINHAVSDDELENYVADYCRCIAENAPLSMRAAKHLVEEITRARADLDHEICERLVEECFASEDYAEGRRAFMEKRKPAFYGR